MTIRYFGDILWPVMFGYLLWNEVAGPTTIPGIVIPIGSGLYIWYRERRGDVEETALVVAPAAEPARSEPAETVSASDTRSF